MGSRSRDRASNGRSAELDVPAIDISSHCSSACSHRVRVFARRMSRCFRQCSLCLASVCTLVPDLAECSCWS